MSIEIKKLKKGMLIRKLNGNKTVKGDIDWEITDFVGDTNVRAKRTNPFGSKITILLDLNILKKSWVIIK